MFLSGNYRLITVPLKFYGLNTNVFARNEASRANLLVLRTPNSIQAATINREFQDINTLLSLLFITKFSSAGQFNSQLIYFKSFEMKAVKANCKWKIRKIKHTKAHLIQFQLFIFYKPTCTEQFSSSTDPGLFRVRAVWADSVSPRNRKKKWWYSLMVIKVMDSLIKFKWTP